MPYQKIPESRELPIAQVAPFDQQIANIAIALYNRKDEYSLAGLLGGDAGIALFFAYLIKSYPDGKYEAIAGEYLEKLSNALLQDKLSHHMSTGIAGIAFVFQHLRNIGLLDPLEDINLDEVDELISIGSRQDFGIGNWDPLHGLVGLGIYFLERHTETGEIKYLEKIVDQLAALKFVLENQWVWVTPGVKPYSKDNYNFGMAHGMPGLLSFLAKVYVLGIRRSVIAELIPSCLLFLLNNRKGMETMYSFPSFIDTSHGAGEEMPEPRPSRNGWCYGDLSMAGALIHCGDALDRPEWKKTGIDIALKTTKIPFCHSGCVDASFCHGTSGLVHQYYRLFQATHNIQFKNAAADWLDLTHKYYYKPEIYAGGYAYQSYDKKKRKALFSPSFGLLEGIAGIGLVFLSFHFNIPPGWDIIFQTDI